MPDAPAPAAATPHHDDWDRHWEDFASESAANPAVAYRARLLARVIEAYGPPERLLDIGVGIGDFLALAAERWPATELAGIDISEAGVAHARARVPQARFGVRDLTLPGPAPEGLESWSTVATCSEVLEHLDQPVDLLRNATRLMAPGCHLLVTVPAGPMSAFDRHIGHRRHYTPELLQAQLAAAGFEVGRIERAGFPFFNLYRAAVRARGQRLVEEAGAAQGEPRPSLRAAMAAFNVLFRLNLPNSRWGLQLVAAAHYAG